MKTHVGKLAITGILGLLLTLPKYGYSQYDDQLQPAPDSSSQYQNPPDNPPNQGDQQMDQDEAQQTAPPDNQPVSTQVFYDQLSPYGQWVNYPNYGYVWIPSAGMNFTPYSTDGHWVYTDYGWTWVSDYPWGWAVFHYGRWAYTQEYGWFWVPGTVWGPAWVAWRHCDGYYGWAPLYPGIDITVSYDWWGNIPVNYWCFVNERYIGDRYVWRHFEPRYMNTTYIRNTTVIRNTYYDNNRHVTYCSGPKREDVERVLHTTIRPVPVHESSRPEQRYDQAHLHLYRPNVTEPSPNEHPAPQRSVPIQQVPQRNQFNQQNNWQRQAPAQQQQQRQQFQQPQQQRQQYQQPKQQYQQPRQQSQQPRHGYQQPQQMRPQYRQAVAQNNGVYRGGNYGGGSRRR